MCIEGKYYIRAYIFECCLSERLKQDYVIFKSSFSFARHQIARVRCDVYYFVVFKYSKWISIDFYIIEYFVDRENILGNLRAKCASHCNMFVVYLK